MKLSKVTVSAMTLSMATLYILTFSIIMVLSIATVSVTALCTITISITLSISTLRTTKLFITTLSIAIFSPVSLRIATLNIQHKYIIDNVTQHSVSLCTDIKQNSTQHTDTQHVITKNSNIQT